jgi:hypothetical protein
LVHCSEKNLATLLRSCPIFFGAAAIQNFFRSRHLQLGFPNRRPEEQVERRHRLERFVEKLDHCMCKEMPVFPVNKVVDQKE